MSNDPRVQHLCAVFAGRIPIAPPLIDTFLSCVATPFEIRPGVPRELTEWITSGCAVIRSPSAASADGDLNFPEPDFWAGIISGYSVGQDLSVF
jgi:hypothetical protein